MPSAAGEKESKSPPTPSPAALLCAEAGTATAIGLDFDSGGLCDCPLSVRAGLLVVAALTEPIVLGDECCANGVVGENEPPGAPAEDVAISDVFEAVRGDAMTPGDLGAGAAQVK
jgi:hypothetical protein